MLCNLKVYITSLGNIKKLQCNKIIIFYCKTLSLFYIMLLPSKLYNSAFYASSFNIFKLSFITVIKSSIADA